MNNLMNQFRALGIVVPFINNVAWPNGVNAPGTNASVDIYGHDAYPLGMNCTDPTYWIDNALPTTLRKDHLNQSASTPYTIPEFQGGAYQAWGQDGFENCALFTGAEFERVFYKNNIAAGITIQNVYMVSSFHTGVVSVILMFGGRLAAPTGATWQAQETMRRMITGQLSPKSVRCIAKSTVKRN
jgi:hypothetical protein